MYITVVPLNIRLLIQGKTSRNPAHAISVFCPDEMSWSGVLVQAVPIRLFNSVFSMSGSKLSEDFGLFLETWFVYWFIFSQRSCGGTCLLSLSACLTTSQRNLDWGESEFGSKH